MIPTTGGKAHERMARIEATLGGGHDWLALGRAVLASQPFSLLMGTQLIHLAPGEAELRLPLRALHLQHGGMAHAGVLGYAADNALTFAGGTRLGADVVTSEYKISVLRPAVGQVLVARATTVHAGRMQAVCRCDLFVEDRHGTAQLCATALGTITRSGAR